MEEGPRTPAQKFQMMFKENFEKFKKTRYEYRLLVGVGVVAAIFYLTLVYLFSTCLISLIPPVAMFGVFWFFDIKRVKMLALAGLITCLVLVPIEAVFYVNTLQDVTAADATSEDGVLLTDGYVTPLLGNYTTVFNYTLTIHLPTNATVGAVHVVIDSEDFMSSEELNKTMVLTSSSADNSTLNYSIETTLSRPINYYRFMAEINGTWYDAANYDTGAPAWIMAPVTSDSWVLMSSMTKFAFYSIFAQFLPMFLIIVGMVWWMRRARRMREKQVTKWEETARKEREAKKAEIGKEDTKVPSLAKAMGLEPEGDSFVCSECGTDVPSEATVCPKCGEKFDAEKAEEQKDETIAPTPAKPKVAERYGDTFVCSECGAEVPGEATKCPKCGEKFD